MLRDIQIFRIYHEWARHKVGLKFKATGSYSSLIKGYDKLICITTLQFMANWSLTGVNSPFFITYGVNITPNLGFLSREQLANPSINLKSKMFKYKLEKQNVSLIMLRPSIIEHSTDQTRQLESRKNILWN